MGRMAHGSRAGVPVPSGPVGSGPACTVTVVVPTRNEAGNVVVLTERVASALAGAPGGWEALFVDDSDDSTPSVVASLAASGAPVRLLHRPSGQRTGGLGGAVQEGFAAARGRVIVVMDADLQHPPEALPLLVGVVLSGSADLAGGSRYSPGGDARGLAGPWRRLVSACCRQVARACVPACKPLADPLSGFFAVERSVVAGAELRADGYKILLEVAARGHWHRAANVPYSFAPRRAGRSKAGPRAGLAFVRHVLTLALATRGQGTRGPALGWPCGLEAEDATWAPSRQATSPGA